LERFRLEPAIALDDLLRGLERVPPYERATPSEILKRLFGTLPRDDADVLLLDQTLRAWLERRWREGGTQKRADYGLSRFVTETMDALAAVWLLRLPECGSWLQDNYLMLAQWGAPQRLSKVWDLPRALAEAAALTQVDKRLRFYWFRLCGEAAKPSQRWMIDPALAGLSGLPGAAGQGAGPDLIAGLARFGAALASTLRDQVDFLGRWRAITVRFPRVPKTWHRLWHNALSDQRYDDRPFRRWLVESEPALGRSMTGAHAVSPPTRQQVNDLFGRIRQGERESVIPEATALFAGYEAYAEATGDAYFVVRFATNVGKEVLPWAPGHVLAWAHAALRWSPSNAHAWSLRGRALVRLGRRDLAQAVYWEAVRRLPDNPVVRVQLALLLEEEGRLREAEALLREVHDVDPKNEGARVEFAQILSRTGRVPEAEALLRRSVDEMPNEPIIVFTLACLLIAWDRPSEAAAVRDLYAKRFGKDRSTTTLEHLLHTGTAGAQESRRHLAERQPSAEDAALRIVVDGPVGARVTATELRGHETLRRSAAVSRADLLFRIDKRAEAVGELAEILREDDDDGYGYVVWALHDPDRRPGLAALYRESFGVLAPHLAAAGPETAAAHWDRLGDEFPHRDPLIEFARLMRGGSDTATSHRLVKWLEQGQEEDDTYFRTRLRFLLDRDGRLEPDAPDQRALLDTLIRREVDLGELAVDEAA